MPSGTPVLTVRVVAVLLATLLAGCAGSPPGSKGRGVSGQGRSALQKVSYQPPAVDALGSRGLAVSQPWWEVERQLAANVAAIKGAMLGPSRSGEVFVVHYAGDPGDYLDCGTINLHDAAGGTPKQVNAAEDKVQLPRTSRHPDGRLERRLRLDSRSTLHITELPGGGTLIDDSTRYVVTKEIHTWAFGGGENGKDKWLGTTRETVSFNTGEAGTFKAGTTCVATGRLEQALFQGLATPTPTPAALDPVPASMATEPPAVPGAAAPAPSPIPAAAEPPAPLPAPDTSVPGLF
jgi:hypothetical protein